MQVFNVYFKILRKLYPMILMYIFIFFGITLIATSSNQNTTNIDFTASKPRIVLINYDSNTPLLNSFNKYLKEKTNIIDISDNEDKLNDALFFRQVHYIIKIPKNFTDTFMNNQKINLDIQKVPDVIQSIYVDSLINNFFNTARLYVASEINENDLSEKIINDLNKEANVKIIQKEKQITSDLTNANYYFNFTNYVFIALSILIVGLIMQTFNKLDIKRRNLCAPLKINKINFQLMLGNLCVVLLIWLLFVLGSILLYSKTMFTINGLTFILNSFLFSLCALSISFLLGNLLKSNEARSIMANVVSLGLSFICGAFVPLSLLGENVIKFARFLPSYWFIKANDIIGSIPKLMNVHFKNIIICMIIVLGYSLIIYLITLMVVRKKRSKE